MWHSDFGREPSCDSLATLKLCEVCATTLCLDLHFSVSLGRDAFTFFGWAIIEQEQRCLLFHIWLMVESSYRTLVTIFCSALSGLCVRVGFDLSICRSLQNPHSLLSAGLLYVFWLW